jgi:hypothetical protein
LVKGDGLVVFAASSPLAGRLGLGLLAAASPVGEGLVAFAASSPPPAGRLGLLPFATLVEVEGMGLLETPASPAGLVGVGDGSEVFTVFGSGLVLNTVTSVLLGKA